MSKVRYVSEKEYREAIKARQRDIIKRLNIQDLIDSAFELVEECGYWYYQCKLCPYMMTKNDTIDHLKEHDIYSLNDFNEYLYWHSPIDCPIKFRDNKLVVKI